MVYIYIYIYVHILYSTFVLAMLSPQQCKHLDKFTFLHNLCAPNNAITKSLKIVQQIISYAAQMQHSLWI